MINFTKLEFSQVYQSNNYLVLEKWNNYIELFEYINQFNSSDLVTWSWNNETAGNLDSLTGLVTWEPGFSGTVIITATSFGCGAASLSRTIVIPSSPTVTRTSALFTTNQSRGKHKKM